MRAKIDGRFTKAGNTDHTGVLRAKPADFRIAYGTAGFRDKADVLPFVAFRVGYLAALRARVLNKAIGLMITASHNPECDNGVKIVDPMGEMLAAEYEKYATELVAASDDDFETVAADLEAKLKPSHGADAVVLCAIDTRASGPHLLAAARAGAEYSGVKALALGVLTTPQLHYAVRVQNDAGFGRPGEKGYYAKLASAFTRLFEITPCELPQSVLHLDCANGVGALKAKELWRALPQDSLRIEFFNANGPLNKDCGADFVKIERKLPSTFPALAFDARCASLDGDADRLVYFRCKEDGTLHLLDGDKIAVLYTKFIAQQLKEASLEDKLSVGIVQTAYANGGSSSYIYDTLKIKPVFVPTGVKHLHHEAMKYDIGVYFEANGHGTVCFSDNFKKLVKNATPEEPAKYRLLLFSEVINEVVGDALADMLAVELLLRHFNWTISDWDGQTYQDKPSIQIKVPVTDRSLFKTTFDETRLTQPEALQAKIDKLVSATKNGRCFVRPSGTENIVRVYAEAQQENDAKALGEQVAELVKALL